MLRKRKWVLLAIVVSLFIGRALLTNKHFHTHDDIQVFRVNEYVQCIKNNQIPCRWSDSLGKGYGYPLFIFYPPVIYLIPTLIHLAGLSIITSLNLLAFLTFPLAAYSMYKFAYVISRSEKLSFLVSVAYTIIPYHALNVFVRGVYAETLAWSVLPLILERIYTLIKTKRKSYSLAILLTLLLLTHNISAMIIYPLSVLWAIILLVKYRPHPSRIKIILLNMLIPIGTSAFFLFPALIEKPLVQTQSMIFGYYSYINHFISLKQLFISNYWGYGGSTFGTEFDGMSFMIGKPYWVIFIIFVGLSFYLWLRSKKRSIDLIAIYFVFFSVVFTFLTHNRSTVIWSTIPLLQYVQFPWRFIGLAGAFMLMSSVYLVRKYTKKFTTTVVLVGATFLILTYSSLFQPEQYDNFTDIDYINGDLTELQKQEHLFDYLPVTANSIPDEFASSLIFDATYVSAVSENRTSSTFELILVAEENDLLTLSIYDYPGWQVYIDDQLAEITPHPNYGFIQLEVSPGRHLIKGKFSDTGDRIIANYISIVFFGYLLWLIFSKGKDNN